MKQRIGKISTIFLCLVMVATFFAVAVPKNAEGPPLPYYGYVDIFADGHYEPFGAPIQANPDPDTGIWTYTLTNDIHGEVTIYTDNIILDGDGYYVWGDWGVGVPGHTGITIRNVVLKQAGWQGIILSNSDDNTIIGNTITIPTMESGFTTCWAICLENSHRNTITGNEIISDPDYSLKSPPKYIYGISLSSSNDNIISGNSITGSYHSKAIYLRQSKGNTIAGNMIWGAQTSYESYDHGICLSESINNFIIGNKVTDLSDTGYGIALWSSDYNYIKGNTVLNNGEGIHLDSSNDNEFFFNNIIDNTKQVWRMGSINTWDNGAGMGNHWSDYPGNDYGDDGIPNTDDKGEGDGVGDSEVPHPYHDQGNGYFQLDNYPLMVPWRPESVEELQDMIIYIQGLSISDGMKNGLISQLEAVERALSDHAPAAAERILEGFLKHIEGLNKAGNLSDNEYDDLLQWAKTVLYMI